MVLPIVAAILPLEIKSSVANAYLYVAEAERLSSLQPGIRAEMLRDLPLDWATWPRRSQADPRRRFFKLAGISKPELSAVKIPSFRVCGQGVQPNAHSDPHWPCMRRDSVILYPRLRHLPVLDEQSRIRGMITRKDPLSCRFLDVGRQAQHSRFSNAWCLCHKAGSSARAPSREEVAWPDARVTWQWVLEGFPGRTVVKSDKAEGRRKKSRHRRKSVSRFPADTDAKR